MCGHITPKPMLPRCAVLARCPGQRTLLFFCVAGSAVRHQPDAGLRMAAVGCLTAHGKPKARRWLFVRLCRYSDQGALLLSGYCRIIDTALCTFWSRSGSIHGAAVERSGTAGGMNRVLPAKVEEGLPCAVGWLLGSGVAGMRAVQASVSCPARPTGCANGAKRSAAPVRVLFR